MERQQSERCIARQTEQRQAFAMFQIRKVLAEALQQEALRQRADHRQRHADE